MTTFQKLIGLSLLIVSLSLAYYLTIYLPQKDRLKENVRKECADWALNKASSNKTSHYNQEAYDDYYTRCLREKGL